MEGLMQSNVIPIRTDESDSREDDFERIYARYLKARGAACEPDQTEEAISRVMNRLERITWEIIRTPAVLQRHIGYRLDVLRDLLQGADPHWTDCRERLLLESIRLDVGEE
jgi:hypothetical protein